MALRFSAVIASEAEQSICAAKKMDCFVASLLAMTETTNIQSPSWRACPAIHVLLTARRKDVDARHKAGMTSRVRMPQFY